MRAAAAAVTVRPEPVDEAEFADPEVFNVGRTSNRHLSFGRGGPHLCLGAHLARLEVRVVLAALARRAVRGEAICVRARTRGWAVACPGLRHGNRARTRLSRPTAAPGCPRQTFHEQVQGVLDRYQRRTTG